MNLKGWINTRTKQTRPAVLDVSDYDNLLAFSGIYVMSPSVFDVMRKKDFRDHSRLWISFLTVFLTYL